MVLLSRTMFPKQWSADCYQSVNLIICMYARARTHTKWKNYYFAIFVVYLFPFSNQILCGEQ